MERADRNTRQYKQRVQKFASIRLSARILSSTPTAFSRMARDFSGSLLFHLVSALIHLCRTQPNALLFPLGGSGTPARHTMYEPYVPFLSKTVLSRHPYDKSVFYSRACMKHNPPKHCEVLRKVTCEASSSRQANARRPATKAAGPNSLGGKPSPNTS